MGLAQDLGLGARGACVQEDLGVGEVAQMEVVLNLDLLVPRYQPLCRRTGSVAHCQSWVEADCLLALQAVNHHVMVVMLLREHPIRDVNERCLPHTCPIITQLHSWAKRMRYVLCLDL
jgi:hypothetical protein